MQNVYKELIEKLEEIGKTYYDIDYLRLGYWDGKYDDEYQSDFKKWFVMSRNDEDSINKLTTRAKEIDYDDGFGSQELFGEVVFKDGTRLERFEYDGAEHWNYKRKPQPKDEDYFTTKH